LLQNQGQTNEIEYNNAKCETHQTFGSKEEEFVKDNTELERNSNNKEVTIFAWIECEFFSSYRFKIDFVEFC
jgi:hypothetical protein